MNATQPKLDDLIEGIRERAGAGGALDRVGAAVEAADGFSQLGDHLVSFFIDEARGAGESWAAIGGRLGISRQAVQKRYAPQPGEAGPQRLPAFYAKMVNDAKRAVVHAQEEARRRRADFIGAEHLLLGVADVPDSAGARSLARCGAAPEVVVAAINGRIGVPSGPPRTDKLPFTADGKSVLEHALRESVRLEHEYVGTGHLALACVTVSGSLAAEVLANLGVCYDALRAAVAELSPAAPPPSA